MQLSFFAHHSTLIYVSVQTSVECRKSVGLLLLSVYTSLNPPFLTLSSLPVTSVSNLLREERHWLTAHVTVTSRGSRPHMALSPMHNGHVAGQPLFIITYCGIVYNGKTYVKIQS